MCGPGLLLAAGKPKLAAASALGGVTGLALAAAAGKKKKPVATAPAPVLEPTASLNNSSNFNKWYG